VLIAQLGDAAVVAIVMWIVLGVCFIATLVAFVIYRVTREDQKINERQAERRQQQDALKRLDRLTTAGHFEPDELPEVTIDALPAPRVRGRLD
jgi:hypothetical protein